MWRHRWRKSSFRSRRTLVCPCGSGRLCRRGLACRERDQTGTRRSDDRFRGWGDRVVSPPGLRVAWSGSDQRHREARAQPGNARQFGVPSLSTRGVTTWFQPFSSSPVPRMSCLKRRAGKILLMRRRSGCRAGAGALACSASPGADIEVSLEGRGRSEQALVGRMGYSTFEGRTSSGHNQI